MAQRTLSTNVKAPVRPAPPPPLSIGKVNTTYSQSAAAIPSSRAPPRPSSEPKKKIAPPRPPPPKASAQLKAVQNAVVFTGMLQAPKRQTQLPLTSSVTAPDLLINWESPPNSPTPGRSSSDGLSLRSFGSDSSGTTANGAFSTMTRSESGFESEPDGWNEVVVTTSTATALVPPAKNESLKPFTMPTIIRPNRSGKPPLPASQPSTHLKELEKIVPIPEKSHIQPRSSSPYLTDLLDLDLSEDYSPPEPTIPPPAPPSFLLTSSPHVERERVDCSPSIELDVSDVPCAVALFDYQSSHSGDLNFKEGDRIVLLSQVNDEWLSGSIGTSEGMFPISFVRIEVPLGRKSDQQTYHTVVTTASSSSSSSSLLSSSSTSSSTYRAVALYAFEAETSQDLSLQEGDIVQVIESAGNGWLFGEDCTTGRRGQFPESFVRREC